MSFIKNKTKKGILATSLTLILVATGAAIGGTYSLFSGSSSASTHITTGNLAFSFKRVKLESKVLGETGLLEDEVDESVVDLTTTGLQAFTATNAVPGVSYETTFSLKNLGTTAFKSSISVIDPVGKDSEDLDISYLLDCFKITMTIDSRTTSFLLSEIDGVNSTLNLGNSLVNSEKTFTVKTEFLSTSDNRAQNCSLTYSLSLNALQILSE
ncbi:MAG: hypothetical protein SOV26_02190 [Candidatus Onthovivens sp.]|nr:hypothetical protein [Candidatus Onthovivens sp.]